MVELTENAAAKLTAPNFAFLATLMEDGSPQVSPVWVDVSDGHVLVNSAIGRRKERNVRRDPRVALSVVDNENQYNKIDIRGRVVELIEGEEAHRHIDKMAKKYLGEETYPFLAPGERRVIFVIEPTSLYEEGS